MRRTLGTLAAMLAATVVFSGCEKSDDTTEPSDNVTYSESSSSSSSSNSDNSEPVEEIILRNPADGAMTGREVTFSWKGVSSVENYIVYTDKGSGPLDGNYEDAFTAGSSTSVSVTLDSSRYLDGTDYRWAVSGVANDGTEYESNTYEATIDTSLDD